MNKLKNKLRSASFWVMVAGAIALVITRIFGVSDASAKIADIVGSVMLALGAAGMPIAEGLDDSSRPTDGDDSDDSQEN